MPIKKKKASHPRYKLGSLSLLKLGNFKNSKKGFVVGVDGASLQSDALSNLVRLLDSHSASSF